MKFRKKEKCLNGNTAVMMINKKYVMTQIQNDNDPSIKEKSDVLSMLEKVEERISEFNNLVNEIAFRNHLMQETHQ